MKDQLSLLWFCVRRPVISIGVLIVLFWLLLGCAHDRCRADGKLPQDKSFDDLRDLKREQCQ